jgi:hypothetical protein
MRCGFERVANLQEEVMKTELSEKLVALICELRVEVDRLKKIVAEQPAPYVIHYHYPPYWYQPQPNPWWYVYPANAANPPATLITIGDAAPSSGTVTNRLSPFTFTNAAGGQY